MTAKWRGCGCQTFARVRPREEKLAMYKHVIRDFELDFRVRRQGVRRPLLRQPPQDLPQGTPFSEHLQPERLAQRGNRRTHAEQERAMVEEVMSPRKSPRLSK